MRSMGTGSRTIWRSSAICATHLRRYNSASDFFEGILHELVILDRQPDSFSLTLLEDYLQSRWGHLTVWDFCDETVTDVTSSFDFERHLPLGET